MTGNYGMGLIGLISDFVKNSVENSLKMEPDEKAFDDVLVGFSAGADPLYNAYKDVVRDLHWRCFEVFSINRSPFSPHWS